MSPNLPKPSTWAGIVIASVLLCQFVQAESRSATVSDPRPIAKAVEHLETLYGFPITYEDPIYVHDSEIVDVTEQVSGDPRNLNRVLIPRGGTVSFTYELPAQETGGMPISETDRKMAMAAALADMLQRYDASRGGNMFTVLENNGLVHVVPSHFIDTRGNVNEIKPLLDTKIFLTSKQQNGAELVRNLCYTLSQTTGQTVIVGNIPYSLLARHATAITGSGVTARSVLDRLLLEMNVHLSWQVFYDPGLHWYALNIHTVVWNGK